MTQREKLLYKVLCGTADASILFSDLCRLLKYLGFEERIRGDHHIFTREGIAEILNLQPKDAQAKPYQVRQVRTLILRYRLGGSDEN
ncbi:MAG TPA: type II toxin-antitoxin system HicA family toxin [Anaerolineae bacterium]|nr:type II toxin-antitoxin system HicA family toxin [Anaerolineae bacterium]HQI83544.1 type II toxin-antitoxin system HicA family toxin [Anaerolineae bacterium]